jgi:hypothetical protein
VARARSLIDSEAEIVLFFAHPTTTFRSASFDSYRELSEGYAVTYTFHWMSTLDNPGASELDFICDSDGRLDFIRVGRSSAPLFKPFRASNAVIGLIKQEMQKDVRYRENRELMRLMEQDAKDVLETYLKRDIAALATLVAAVAGGTR